MIRISKQVKTTKNTISQGLIIPVGTVGNVIDLIRIEKRPHLIVNFGLVALVRVPTDSPLIETL